MVEAQPAAFDLQRLQRQLGPLELSTPPRHGDAEQAYFQFYGIDFPVRHWFGHLSSGRYEIVAHYFEPEQPVGTCFVQHGYFDHVGLYRHVIDFCLHRNLAVIAYDLPGHGLSTGERGAISDFSEYRRVFMDLAGYFEGRAPAPWRLIAQSTGAAVHMDYLLDTPEPVVRDSVLLAPLVRTTMWRGIRAAYTLGRPFLARVKRRFGESSGDHGFTDFVAHHDPLQTHHIPLSWIGAMLAWESRFDAMRPCEHAPLVVQGQRDLTVAWRHNLNVIREKFPRARVFQLARAQHQLANECESIRGKVFAAIDLFWSERDTTGQ